MNGLLLSGMVALATFTLVHAAAVAPSTPTPSCKDLMACMDDILKEMIKRGPTSDNQCLNTFISILIEADKITKASASGFMTGDQVKDITNRGLEAIGCATNTSKQNMDIMRMLLVQGDSKSTTRNTDSIVKMLGQATCYLGDRTPESLKRIYDMFIVYKPKESAVGKKADTLKLGSSKPASKTPAKQAVPAKPATPAKPTPAPKKG